MLNKNKTATTFSMGKHKLLSGDYSSFGLKTGSFHGLNDSAID